MYLNCTCARDLTIARFGNWLRVAGRDRGPNCDSACHFSKLSCGVLQFGYDTVRQKRCCQYSFELQPQPGAPKGETINKIKIVPLLRIFSRLRILKLL